MARLNDHSISISSGCLRSPLGGATAGRNILASPRFNHIVSDAGHAAVASSCPFAQKPASQRRQILRRMFDSFDPEHTGRVRLSALEGFSHGEGTNSWTNVVRVCHPMCHPLCHLLCHLWTDTVQVCHPLCHPLCRPCTDAVQVAKKRNENVVRDGVTFDEFCRMFAPQASAVDHEK